MRQNVIYICISKNKMLDFGHYPVEVVRINRTPTVTEIYFKVRTPTEKEPAADAQS